MSVKELQDKLDVHLKAHYPSKGRCQVRDLAKADQGWETEIYYFVLEEELERETLSSDMVLRMYAGDGAERKSTKEFRAMAKLHENGFPVPRVYFLETDKEVLGQPFILMERIWGRSMGEVMQTSSAEAQEGILDLFCKIFVDLHKCDITPFCSDRSIMSDPSACDVDKPDRYLTNLFEYARTEALVEVRVLGPILDWLVRGIRNVACWKLAPIHLDYHFYNVLMRSDGRPFVIDWTNFDIADYRIDLAWSLLLTSTYGHLDMRDCILGKYERIVGTKVKDIEYFEAVAAARRLYSIFVSLSAGPEKLGMRPETAEIMKRQKGHVMNVINFLEERTGITIGDLEGLL